MVFSQTAKKFGKKTCIIFENQVNHWLTREKHLIRLLSFLFQRWSFVDLEVYSNRVANIFYNAGYQPGECVALFMENRPEYVGLWLGCTKLGLVPALINSNLVGDSLLHSIEVTK